MKIAVIGCGLRTPLLVYGIVHSDLEVSEIALYDVSTEHAGLAKAFGEIIARDSSIRITADPQLSRVVEGSSFVISSIRVGGMEARAHDERLALQFGCVGQETTGPAGFAMALRTIPVALEHARVVRDVAPDAWIINFTNPAGLITQAVLSEAGPRVVGICDTPTELFVRIAWTLGASLADVECEYFGLNHLGWIRTVRLRGRDVTERLLSDDEALQRLYGARLFSPDLIRALGLIPSEYLFFYYQQRSAIENQRRAGATRGEELVVLNTQVWARLRSAIRSGDSEAVLQTYRNYLNRRNSSYLRLEAAGESALTIPEVDWNPFEAATGYHRIAIETMEALLSNDGARLVLNVPNDGAIRGLANEDVVELSCTVDRMGARPAAVGSLPEAVRALTITVKIYERLTLRASLQHSRELARLALFTNPMVGDWSAASGYLDSLKSEF